MINISDAAQTHFIKLLTSQTPDTQIRVFVVNPGTPKAECGVSYCPLDAIEENDIEIKFPHFSVFIDEISKPFLAAAEIDFTIDSLGSQLTLKAPNAKAVKVNNDAPLIDRVTYILQAEINPQLSAHGGIVSLIEITEDNYVILQFGGGCNGCSMVDYTLKEGIEKTLLTHFPDLKGVKDITEHQRGEHSFY